MSEKETIVRPTSTRMSQPMQQLDLQTGAPGYSNAPTHTDGSGRVWSGRTLGEYEIGGLLGKGGNGEVYRATHRWLARPVAIKFLVGVRADDYDSTQRFQREARVAAAMIHPNIVRATDGGTVGQQLFLVTDLVDGCDLSQLVERYKKIGVANVCAIGFQAATALGFIAARNTVHRDVKPSNLMLDREGTVKLLDLGLARVMDHGHTMTATGQVMGTIDFMAPEQATDPRRVDHRADIYSLGCTLYFLLAGRAPFSTDHLDTIAAKLLATMESDPIPIRTFRREVPTKLAELIESMLDKDPSRRPRDFESVAKSLQPMMVGANLVALASIGLTPDLSTQAARTTITSHVEDFIAASARSTARLILQACGVVEPVAGLRPGQRQSYRFSFRWLRGIAVIGAFAWFLWFTGFRIQTYDEDYSPDVYPTPVVVGL